MEIERKFLIHSLPAQLSAYPKKQLTQGYLSVSPVLRVRAEDADYILTYKGSGLLSHEEYNLPLTKDAFVHLLSKADGTVIEKTRYFLPFTEDGALLSPEAAAANALREDHHRRGKLIELDIFSGALSPLIVAEIEFPTEEAANAFQPLPWFKADVTLDSAYHNSSLSQKGLPEGVLPVPEAPLSKDLR